MARMSYILLATLFLVVALFYPYITDSKDGERPMREIVALTTLPPALSDIISAEYEKKSKTRIIFQPIPDAGITDELLTGSDAILVVANKDTLLKAKKNFAPYISEYWDAAPESMKDENALWTGIFYDPIVFCMNADYLKANKNAPLTWQNLAKTPGVKIGMTDFLAADAMQNLLFSMIAEYGDAAAYQIWRGIHPNVIQYAKYLNNPVRQAGMGEADVAVAVESEAIRYLNDDYPLKIIYPRDGTAYMLIGSGIVKDKYAEDEVAAKEFSDWMQTDEAHQILQANGFYFIPVNPATLTYKSYAGKDLYLYTMPTNFTNEQKHNFLDRWVKYIRLGGR